MEETLNLNIVTSENLFYCGKITSIITQNEEGRFQILPNHMYTIAKIVPSVAEFTEVSGKKLRTNTDYGIIKVRNNEITLLCDKAEWEIEGKAD